MPIEMNTDRPPQVTKRYRGVIVPMVTPVTPWGELDEAAIRRVVDHLVEGGVAGIFVMGTTGEAPSIPRMARSRLVAIAVEQARGRAMIYAGISDHCLAESVQAAEAYFRLGANVVVAHLPFYYALSPEEQVDYYCGLADRLPGPLMLYNIPITTHVCMTIEVVDRLSEHPRIIGLKDSENSLARLEEMVRRLGGRPDFSIFAGVSAFSAEALRLGADGIVPSCGNLVPDVCQSAYESGVQGDMANAEKYQQQMDQVTDIYCGQRTLGQSLAALKAAMGALGLCRPDVWPPLRLLDVGQQEMVRRQFREWQAG